MVVAVSPHFLWILRETKHNEETKLMICFDSFALQVGTGTLQEATGCLELFQEDVDELRSSTEELYFMERQKGQTECEKPLSAQVMNEFFMTAGSLCSPLVLARMCLGHADAHDF
jgi:hypothetical protein